jgi:phosphate-selective porin
VANDVKNRSCDGERQNDVFMNKLLNFGNGLRVTALMIATSLAFGAQADSGRTLTQLLVEKGVITESEAATIGAQTPAGLVELLVAKGIISSDEAASLEAPSRGLVASHPAPAPEAAPAPASPLVQAKEKVVEKLTVFGRVHGQWDLLSTDYDSAENPDTVNNLFLRRVYLGAKADFADGVSGTINGTFANGADGTSTLEKGIIEIELSPNHTLTAGYQKVFLGYEEVMSSSKIAAVERSVATRYFTEDLDMGARHTGVFLTGEYDSGIYFNLAATNSEANNVSGSSTTDAIALWAALGWQGDLAGGSLDAGVAAGRIPDTLVDGETDTVWDLYANFKTGNFNLLAEILGGKLGGAGDAKPLSYTLTPSFKLSRQFELVGRFSHLDTDGGRGADISTVFRRAPENGGARFDDVSAYYLGGNWYIRGNALKLSAGYEWASFEDNLNGSQGDANVDGFRTRLQLHF